MIISFGDERGIAELFRKRFLASVRPRRRGPAVAAQCLRPAEVLASPADPGSRPRESVARMASSLSGS